MWMIALGAAFSIFFVGINIRDYLKVTNKIHEQIGDQQFKIFDYSKSAVSFNILMAGLSVLLAATSSGNDFNVALSIALVGSFVGNAIIAKANRKLLYNEKGFFIKDQYFRYKSIQNIKVSGKWFKEQRIHTFSNQSVAIHPKALAIVESLWKASK